MTKPTTYDEIIRATVPDPDSSFRPSAEQVQQAREGFRALDGDEQALADRVRAALAASGVPSSRVEFDVERSTVTLRGAVADATALVKLGDAVRALDGVELVDRLVIGPA